MKLAFFRCEFCGTNIPYTCILIEGVRRLSSHDLYHLLYVGNMLLDLTIYISKAIFCCQIACDENTAWLFHNISVWKIKMKNTFFLNTIASMYQFYLSFHMIKIPFAGFVQSQKLWTLRFRGLLFSLTYLQNMYFIIDARICQHVTTTVGLYLHDFNHLQSHYNAN